MIQKLETGYLELLRVVFLAGASIAIFIAIYCGVSYAVQHDAEPEEVKDEIKLTLTHYEGVATRQIDQDESPAPPGIAVRDGLYEKFSANLTKLGKNSDQSFSLNKDAARSLYSALKEDSTLGIAFIEQLNGVLEAAATKPEIVAGLRDDFSAELNRLMEFAKSEYKLQSDLITAKREKAEADAEQKRVSAQVSLYTAGVLFLIFVGLILLTVLLKIERNLRHGEINKSAASG